MSTKNTFEELYTSYHFSCMKTVTTKKDNISTTDTKTKKENRKKVECKEKKVLNCQWVR